ncbi:MAG: serine/threonine-protein kinase [Thermoanaerobaculia bacterium]
MKRCPNCSSEVEEAAAACPWCGQALSAAASQMPTGLASPSIASAAQRKPPASVVGRLASSESIDGGGFTPGTVIAERYRVIGLIGRGGMGEVYRADDLKLGQPVALKFLPRDLAGNRVRLDRFFAEVRTARQVSHPNVCRVYDIAEVDGQHFLSMEYVDGEDLASLLKRIGRLPPDKALDVARQICAGLAAAHDRGVLHRDLKPANVMLDGRGRARITDFGLAAVAGEAPSADDLAGTPAYMAPEQFQGKSASVRSDLYALGLVLYELYTGKRAVDAVTIAGYRRKHTEETPTAPSAVIKEMDPAVERVILRCMEKDPQQRPASAAQVALALPGGDPLAAALAAGETPSPEMVAAAGGHEGLEPRLAWSIAGAGAVMLLLAALLLPGTRLLERMSFRKSPEVMSERAREILGKLGYGQEPADTANGFYVGRHFLRWVMTNDPSPRRFDRLAADAMPFWYRESPRPMAPQYFSIFDMPATRVDRNDPPLEVPGMGIVFLDSGGRLEQLAVVPPQHEDDTGPAPAPDWAPLFSEAGLDPALYTPVEPRWTPRTFADARAAWEGPHPDRPELRGRIEAAAYRGRPVSFLITGPWDYPGLQAPYQPTTPELISTWTWYAIFVGLLVAAILVARRNVRLERGDWKGASRLGLAVGLASLASWALGSSHTATEDELTMFLNAFGAALFNGFIVAVFYLALEPFIRRRWPHALVSWNRLISGRARDGIVGRDILVGAAAGASVLVVWSLVWRVADGFAGAPPVYGALMTPTLLGGLSASATVLERAIWALIESFLYFFVFVVLQALLRKVWLALPAAALLVATLAAGSITPGLSAGFFLFLQLVFLVLTVRLGFLAGAAFMVAHMVLFAFAVTADPKAWYAGSGFLALGVVAALILWGVRASVGRRAAAPRTPAPRPPGA